MPVTVKEFFLSLCRSASVHSVYISSIAVGLLGNSPHTLSPLCMLISQSSSQEYRKDLFSCDSSDISFFQSSFVLYVTILGVVFYFIFSHREPRILQLDIFSFQERGIIHYLSQPVFSFQIKINFSVNFHISWCNCYTPFLNLQIAKLLRDFARVENCSPPEKEKSPSRSTRFLLLLLASLWNALFSLELLYQLSLNLDMRPYKVQKQECSFTSSGLTSHSLCEKRKYCLS